MLYLIGGVARSGKTMLAKRMLYERGVPYLPTDTLMVGFREAIPEYGVRRESTDAENATLLSTFLDAVAENLLLTVDSYLLEGVLIRPESAAKLQEQVGPSALRTCFLGYPAVSPIEKMQQIRLHPSIPHDWLAKHDDDYVLEMIDRMKHSSQDLETACRHAGVTFFDVSEHFQSVMEDAFRHLVAN